MEGLSSILTPGFFDMRRKAQLARGGPTDHAGECVLIPTPSFNLDKTIFTAITGAVTRNVIRDRLAVLPYWSDLACERISQLYSSVPKAIPHDRAILEFMDKECNFNMEHADGSFMDHLQFCYEYSAVYFKEHSPRVLLLHSIMGVGTNYFPMQVDKVPALQSCVTDVEFRHIEAFPSILRLLYHGPLLQELGSRVDLVDQIESITFHRVIDNKKLTMSAAEFWVQLNYQLIHLLDFLPASDWEQATGDAFLYNFQSLHVMLSKSGKLEAQVQYGLKPMAPADASTVMPKPPISLGGMLRKVVPAGKQLAMARNQLVNFSAAISHSLQYTLQWKSPPSRL